MARQKTPWIYCQLRKGKSKTCGLIKGLPVCGFLNDVTKDILSMCTTLIQEQICTYNTCQMISYLISYLSWKSYIHKYCKKQQLFFHKIPLIIIIFLQKMKNKCNLSHKYTNIYIAYTKVTCLKYLRPQGCFPNIRYLCNCFNDNNKQTTL